VEKNRKYLLGTKSLYWYDFWRIVWHWRLELCCWKFSFHYMLQFSK